METSNDMPISREAPTSMGAPSTMGTSSPMESSPAMEAPSDRKGMLDEVRAVRNYLESLTPSKSSGEEAEKSTQRKLPSPETVERRIASVDAKIPGANTMAKLDLIQKRKELESQLVLSNKAAKAGPAGSPAATKEDLERGFINNAKPYSERKGISYAAWREMKVPPRILKAAGITRAG